MNKAQLLEENEDLFATIEQIQEILEEDDPDVEAALALCENWTAEDDEDVDEDGQESTGTDDD